MFAPASATPCRFSPPRPATPMTPTLTGSLGGAFLVSAVRVPARPSPAARAALSCKKRRRVKRCDILALLEDGNGAEKSGAAIIARGRHDTRKKKAGEVLAPLFPV